MAADAIKSNKRRRIKPETVDQAVEHFATILDMNPTSIRGRAPRRDWEHCRARWQIWAYLAEPGVSVASLARAWPCDHTTIRNGLLKLGIDPCR